MTGLKLMFKELETESVKSYLRNEKTFSFASWEGGFENG
jgi:hypothetical protein